MVSSISNGKKAIQILGKRENRNMAGFKMRQGGTTQLKGKEYAIKKKLKTQKKLKKHNNSIR